MKMPPWPVFASGASLTRGCWPSWSACWPVSRAATSRARSALTGPLPREVCADSCRIQDCIGSILQGSAEQHAVRSDGSLSCLCRCFWRCCRGEARFCATVRACQPGCVSVLHMIRAWCHAARRVLHRGRRRQRTPVADCAADGQGAAGARGSELCLMQVSLRFAAHASTVSPPSGQSLAVRLPAGEPTSGSLSPPCLLYPAGLSLVPLGICRT